MTLIEELQHVVNLGRHTPEGTRFEVMGKEALPLLKDLMTKMRCFSTRNWELMSEGKSFEQTFALLTKYWTTDYAFIVRYEDDHDGPVNVSLIERKYPTVAIWLYLTGGIGNDSQEICAGEHMDLIKRPRGIIRKMLFDVGIREIRMRCLPDSAMHRGSTTAGYEFQEADGHLEAVRTLTREEYDKVYASPTGVVSARAGSLGAPMRGSDEAHFPFQTSDAGPGGSLAGSNHG